MNELPAIFLSHGAPDLPIREGAAQQFLRALHKQIPRPKAILVISAHWLSDSPVVSATPQPRTIHDFSGFPKQLYELSYPASGDPELAARASELLTQAGITCEVHPFRGLDHGAWTPLTLIYPKANIPVIQLSIQPYRDPRYHWEVGQALEALRQEGVLIIGSGSATHNLNASRESYSASPPEWVTQFDDWLAKTITQGNWDDLLNYRQLAPYAQENHPTEEHLLPLFVALGAGGKAIKGQQLYRGFTYGTLSMAAYAC
ncbi:4,5-DOPA dioxygenase extradiol [Acaryochloris thomasi RCC1774]|uniref:4,5-DOPA dioxygenase extradiol n=1 Tax=Acaryochloris thomasi RCC1774 TaxID=1764569 RepID=A0A2W1JTD5_9CYAN|nr:class III extradiol ring-cleavage dioxygenase [Acaryochloris thomasi]PZD72191.1 4,5-DOPA dioxygenase extradiol [Acaryochloris thomasi RCC1774]